LVAHVGVFGHQCSDGGVEAHAENDDCKNAVDYEKENTHDTDGEGLDELVEIYKQKNNNLLEG